MSGPQPPGNSPRLPSWLWASTAAHLDSERGTGYSHDAR
jgi:hypothetical protein